MIVVHRIAAVTACVILSATLRVAVAAEQEPATGADLGPNEAEAQALEEITVTGSRLVTSGADMPTPVTLITADELQKSAPGSIPDALNLLPQFNNSLSPAKTLAASSSTALGNYLNLRNLGINRTLILLDGLRVPPTDATGGVDVNSLPQMLVQRVDVVTGGASAVYGSDAVTGVVNYVLDKKFEGLKSLAQFGSSGYGDGESYRVGIAGGTALLDGRLRLSGSAEHYDNKGVLLKSDRPLGRNPDGSYRTYVSGGEGTAQDPYFLVPNAQYSFATDGGLIASGPLAYSFMFAPDGTLVPYRFGEFITGCCTVGGDGASIPADAPPLITPLETTQTFGRLSFELAPSVTAYAQASYSETKTQYISWPAFYFCPSYQCPTMFPDNAFLRPEVQAALGGSEFTLSRLSNLDQPRDSTRQSGDSLFATAGLEGGFGSWSWNVAYSRGESNVDTVARQTESARFFAAVDAVTDPAGNIVCRVTLTNPGLFPGCVPLNLFGVGAPSAAAADYIRADSVWGIQNVMDVFAASLKGDLFDLPAGHVSMALGGEYRKQKLRQTSNSDPAVAFDSTGLRAAPVNAQHFMIDNVGIGGGEVTVKEAFAEIVVPLLAKLPLIHSLELNGAIRHTDYSTSGGVNTHKVGLVWAPVEDFRIRGTVSRDIRAPSLFELYAGEQVTTTSLLDPHTNTAGAMVVVTGGNRDLDPEEGTTSTVGFVYQPRQMPNLVVSVDAYRLEIEDAIAVTSADQQVLDCELSNGTAPVCALIDRPLPFEDRTPANRPTSIRVTSLNLSNLRQTGIDFDVMYRLPRSLLGGDVSLRALISHIADFDTKQSPTTPTVEQAGFAPNPKWRGNLSINYRNDPFSLVMTERMTSSFEPSSQNVWREDIRDYPSAFYTDVTAAWKLPFGRESEVFLTVNNLLNKKAPLTAAPIAVTNPGTELQTERRIYDVMGIYFTLGTRLSF